jgi:hypothetical protein
MSEHNHDDERGHPEMAPASDDEVAHLKRQIEAKDRQLLEVTAVSRELSRRLPWRGPIQGRLESIPVAGNWLGWAWRIVKTATILVAVGLVVGGGADAWDGITHPDTLPLRAPWCHNSDRGQPTITFSKERPMPWSEADGRYGVEGLPNQGFAQLHDPCRSLLRARIPGTAISQDIGAQPRIKETTVKFVPITTATGYQPPRFVDQVQLQLSRQELRDNALFTPDTEVHGDDVTLRWDILGGAEMNPKPGHHLTPAGETDQWAAMVTYKEAFTDKIKTKRVGVLTLNTLRANDPKGFGLIQHFVYTAEGPMNARVKELNQWIAQNIPGWARGLLPEVQELHIDASARSGDMIIRQTEHVYHHGARKWVADPLTQACADIKVCNTVGGQAEAPTFSYAETG